MALSRSRIARWISTAHREYVHIFVLLLVAWASLFFLRKAAMESSWWNEVLFVLGASATGALCLTPIRFYERIGFLPNLLGFLMLLLVVPVAGTTAYAALHVLFAFSLRGTTANDLWLVLSHSPAAAAAVFVGDFLFSLFLLRLGVKRRVVLDLLPEERQSLLEDFETSGLLEQVHFVEREELIRHLEEGKPQHVDFIVISKEGARRFDDNAVLIRAHLAGIPILDACTISSHLTKRIKLPLTDQWSFLDEAVPQTISLRLYHGLKVLFEPVLAMVMLVLFLPLMFAIGVLIRLTSEGPALYRQRRLGYRGKPFLLIKFRTMRIDAERDGPQWSSKNDARVTRLGNFLRRTRLDELPQLLNISLGEMSFVGPRPERPELYDRLKERVPLFPLRTVVRPGITGWAQVKAGYAATIEESHIKLEYDLYYIQNMSPMLDLNVLVRTAIVAILGERKEQRLRSAVHAVKSALRAIRRGVIVSRDASYVE